MSQSINIGGVEYKIEGDDIATEATLSSILNVLQKTKGANLKDEEKRQKLMEKQNKNLDESNKGFEKFDEAMKKSSSGAGSALKNFGEKAVGLINPLNWLGDAVGLATSAFMASVGAVSQMSDGMKELYSTGIRFQGGFHELAVQAAYASIGVDTFVKMISKHQNTILRLGDGNLAAGVQRLTQVTNLVAPNLAGLGVNAEEAAEFVANTAESMQFMTGKNMYSAKVTGSVTTANSNLATQVIKNVNEFDSMALATGKTRQELSELYKMLAHDVDFTSITTALNFTPGQVDGFTKFGAFLQAMPGGESIGAGIKDMLRYGTFTGETAAALQQAAPGLAGTLGNIIEKLKANPDAIDSVTEEMSDALVQNYDQIMRYYASLPDELRSTELKNLAVAAQGAKARQAAESDQLSKWMDLHQGEYKDREDARKQMIAQRNAESKAWTDLTNLGTKLRSTFTSLVLRIFDNPYIIKAVDWFAENFSSLADALNTKLQAFGNIIENIMKGPGTVWDKIRDILGATYDQLFKPIVDSFLGFMKDFFNTDFKEFVASLFAMIPGGSGIARTLRTESAMYKMKGDIGEGMADQAEDAINKWVDVKSKIDNQQRENNADRSRLSDRRIRGETIGVNDADARHLREGELALRNLELEEKDRRNQVAQYSQSRLAATSADIDRAMAGPKGYGVNWDQDRRDRSNAINSIPSTMQVPFAPGSGVDAPTMAPYAPASQQSPLLRAMPGPSIFDLYNEQKKTNEHLDNIANAVRTSGY